MGESMKILQVSYEGLGNGGIQSVIMSICRGICDSKFDILLFTSEKRYYDDEFEELGGKIFRIPHYEKSNVLIKKLDYYIRFLRIFIGTYKLIKLEGPYDVIHCHNDFESGICNLAAYFAGVKIRISHAHTADSKLLRKNIILYIYRRFLQMLMNLSSNCKIGCTIDSFKSIFGEKYLYREYSYIIPNPIDLVRFNKAKDCKLLTDMNIVHVGRYSDNKNQIRIIEIFSLILKAFPNSKLKLVGTGEEYKKHLQKKVSSLKLDSYVEFLSSNTDVKEVLEEAALFMFPSKHEGFGIAVVEAQAMEVPCLVSDSVPKEVDFGLCKFISLSKSNEEWATEAIKVLNNNHFLKLNRKKLKMVDLNDYVRKFNDIYGGNYFESCNIDFS